MGDNVQELDAPNMKYIAEQDGAVEQELKARLIPILSRDVCVSAAYLLRVCYGDEGEQRVALALVGPPAEAILEEIGAEFGQMFSNTESLDLLFLEDEDRREVDLVANHSLSRSPILLN